MVRQKRILPGVRTQRKWRRCQVSGRLVRDYDPEYERWLILNGTHIKKKNAVYKFNCIQNCHLLNLPGELLFKIFSDVSCVDIKMLMETCKSLGEYINRNFIVEDVYLMALAPENLRKLAGRSILSVIIHCHPLFSMTMDEYISMIKKMNLTHVKKIDFFCTEMKGMFFQHIPKPTYVSALTYHLTHSPYLQKLNMMIGIKGMNPNINNVFDIFATRLNHLKELTLTSEGYCPPINIILQKVLLNPSIKILRLKEIATASPFSFGSTYYLDIRSDHLEVLEISDKFEGDGRVKVLECPNLKKMYFNRDADDNLKEYCLYHGQMYEENDLPDILFEGCPKLEWYNNTDIEALREAGLGNWVAGLSMTTRKGSGCPCHYCDSECDSDCSQGSG